MPGEKEDLGTAEAKLPSAAFLNYIGNTTAPTRIRTIAARGLWVSGGIYLLLGIVLIGVIAQELPGQVKVRYGVTPVFGVPPMKLIGLIMDDFRAPVVLVATVLLLGAAQILFAKPVRRGSAGACNAAIAGLVPLAFPLIIGAFMCTGAAVLKGLGLEEGRIRPAFLLLILPAFLGVVLFLLLKDLVVYLRWIAKNPIAENPSVGFFAIRERSL